MWTLPPWLRSLVGPSSASCSRWKQQGTVERKELKERFLPSCFVCGTDSGTRRKGRGKHWVCSYLVLVIRTHTIPGLWVVLPVPAVNRTGGLEFLF